MLIRRNSCYRPTFVLDRRGLLLITRKLILVIGARSRGWA